MSNIYFLLIGIMQTIKRISITNGKCVMAVPLGFVIFVSMLKDAFEDYQRYKSDKEENEKKAYVYNPSTKNYELKQWRLLKPGMLIKVLEDQFFPADLIVMQSSGDNGGLYVETKNLDGETNLKSKVVERKIQGNYSDSDKLQGLNNAKIECEQPNNAIYKFEGKI